MKTKRVLIVEDAPVVRDRLLSLTSEIAGLDVVWVAESVREAREVLGTLRLDVALVDLRLPDGSGLDVLREIRANRAGVFVAILTAFDGAQVRQSCLAAGADAFLSKTSEIDDLPALLRSVVEGGV